MTSLQLGLTLIVIIADIYAIYSIMKSDADVVRKLIWVLLVALLPAFGLMAWVIVGPKMDRPEPAAS